MGRHAQPREVAELKGATRHDPQRYTEEVPKSGLPLGTAPDHLTDEAKAAWFEIETYALRGVLTGAERLAMETLSNLVAEYREAPKEFAVGKYTHMIGLIARLGMTPADRQKLGTDPTKPDNPFNEF